MSYRVTFLIDEESARSAAHAQPLALLPQVRTVCVPPRSIEHVRTGFGRPWLADTDKVYERRVPPSPRPPTPYLHTRQGIVGLVQRSDLLWRPQSEPVHKAIHKTLVAPIARMHLAATNRTHDSAMEVEGVQRRNHHYASLEFVDAIWQVPSSAGHLCFVSSPHPPRVSNVCEWVQPMVLARGAVWHPGRFRRRRLGVVGVPTGAWLVPVIEHRREVRTAPAVAHFVDVATDEYVGIEPDNSPKRSTKHVELIKDEGIPPALAIVACHVPLRVGEVIPHRQ
eukprot:3176049-Prymnesium_polylepis.1